MFVEMKGLCKLLIDFEYRGKQIVVGRKNEERWNLKKICALK